MNAKHTMGPWFYELDKGLVGHYTVWSSNKKKKFFIADCYEDSEADACLIAAAPEMLEALKDLIDNVNSSSVREKARATISKAEGRS